MIYLQRQILLFVFANFADNMIKISTAQCILFLLFFSKLGAQDVEVSVSTKLGNYQFFKSIDEIADFDTEKFLAFGSNQGKYYFSLFDHTTLNGIGGFAIEKPNNVYNCKSYLINNKIYFFYSVYDKGSDILNIYASILDSKGKFLKKDKKLGQFESSSKRKIGKIKMYLSPNKHHILITRDPNNRNFEEESMELLLADSNLNINYNKNVNFPFKGRDMKITEIVITDSATVVLSVQWNERHGYDDKKTSLHNNFTIFGIYPKEKEMRELSFAESNYKFETIKANYNNQTGKIFFVGIFQKDIEKTIGANSIYYFELDESKWQIANKTETTIPKDKMAAILKGNSYTERKENQAKQNSDKGIGLYKYRLQYVFTHSQNQLTLILEKSYSASSTSSTQPSTTFYSSGILQISINTEGAIVDFRLAPNAQISNYSREDIGFLPVRVNGKINYIFGDNIKNLDPKKVAKHNNSNYFATYTGAYGVQKGVLCLGYPEGDDWLLKKKKLFESKKESFDFNTTLHLVAENYTLFIQRKQDDFYIVKIAAKG